MCFYSAYAKRKEQKVPIGFRKGGEHDHTFLQDNHFINNSKKIMLKNRHG
jgi:hypothetical protein